MRITRLYWRLATFPVKQRVASLSLFTNEKMESLKLHNRFCHDGITHNSAAFLGALYSSTLRHFVSSFEGFASVRENFEFSEVDSREIHIWIGN